MSKDQINRRSAIALVGTAVAAAALAGSSAPAAADQGNMEHALRLLNQAIGALQSAPDNKGGHKHNAVQLIEQAIDEVQAGIDFADTH